MSGHDAVHRATSRLSAAQVSRRSLLFGGLAAASAPLLLSGCSNRASTSGEPLQFWNFYAPSTQTAPELKAQNDWFMKAIADWNGQHPEQVEAVFIPAYTDPTNTRLATAFASGSGPDIFLISPGDFSRYYNGGALEDLRPYMTQEAVDDYTEGSLATRSVDGKIYALPMENEPLAMYYSPRAWEAAGLSEGDIPTTWEQMFDVAEKLTTPTQSGVVFETIPGYYQNFTWYPWMWQGGGEVVDPRTQRAAFDSEGAIQALELFGEATRRRLAPRTMPAAGDLVGAFTEGFAAMWQSGIWQVANFRGNAPDFDYGVFPLPTPPGGETRTVLGGWAFAVNARGRNPEAAARFVVETVGSTSDASVDRLTEWAAVAKSDMPTRISVDKRMRETGAYDDPKMAYFRDVIFDTGRGEPRYPPVLYKAVSNAIQSVQSAGGDAADQAAIAHSAIEAYLTTYEGAPLL
ncbi:multiple sugar transport system substrate-binding protein [Diaminobutyricimonas aerilata]|uniref:Multiple sugar transport system substrate-binding protein n=1 Tax=Diaminobutyricimonas aerilata TaxID=1162967 RepID=A0A2M9CHM4_9MICO|nr:sugar ABC transporter substrate-binding protein [Diaminobutyricimonas aerilata]PJJ71369.1 multiple sugar transport system substrate-binding protein [Diaminobutyricimonas aerilata]